MCQVTEIVSTFFTKKWKHAFCIVLVLLLPVLNLPIYLAKQDESLQIYKTSLREWQKEFEVEWNFAEKVAGKPIRKIPQNVNFFLNLD